MRSCLRVLLQYKALDTVLCKWPTWEQGWLRSVCASSQSVQTLFFSHIVLRRTYKPKTHTGLQKYKKYQLTSCGGVLSCGTIPT